MSQDTVQIPTEKLLEAFLHSKQFEQHYATQESVDNLKERMNEKFADADKRFEQIDRRFDKLEKKFDRMQWLIVSAALIIIFKEHLFKLFT
jgi:tRNA(Phe) wybutosine-synthesizing methylase Tyw3